MDLLEGMYLLDAIKSDDVRNVEAWLNTYRKINSSNDVKEHINQLDEYGNTYLYYAWNNLDIFKLLLDHGADIYAENHENQRAIDIAISNEDWPQIAYLSNNMDIERRYADDTTILMRCANLDNGDIISLLIKAGADVNALNLYVEQNPNYRNIQLLLHHGARISSPLLNIQTNAFTELIRWGLSKNMVHSNIESLYAYHSTNLT